MHLSEQKLFLAWFDLYRDKSAAIMCYQYSITMNIDIIEGLNIQQALRSNNSYLLKWI